ncbi:TonB-dependent receptor [Terricaulis silvestris]|uniref:Colicin I receptor n=1 Tax=Terricaulis silvestris TaxID=2686094 RepID=A0A6I6MPS1_9CAUL|nr:TonB-dependent receptor [Terricaulis silvestris]QGZ96161.1 Colicin I receptor precursor [Terricaulis silvestris]
MKIGAKRALLWATTVLSLAAPAIAEAQTTEGEIVVTARRREENIQDVPLAVSALGAEQIEREGITNIMDLNGSVPNLVVSNGLGSGRSTPVFTIRGLSQQDLTMLSDPSVSLYVNEVPVPRPIGANLGFFDTANVQVLRGPQGTLFGRNTVGGAILVTPAAPTSDFEGAISQSAANFGTYETQGFINVPLDGSASIRVAGMWNQSDGYITDLVTGNEINSVDERAFRVGFDFHPTDSFNSLFTVMSATSDNGGTGGYNRTGAGTPFAHGRHETRSGLVNARSEIDVFSFENISTLELNEHVTFKNIAGYRELQNNTLEDTDGSDVLYLTIQRVTEQNQVSNELQLQLDYDWGNVIFGGFYFREKGDDQGLSAGSGAGAANPAADGVLETFEDLRDLPAFSDTWVGGSNTSWAIFAEGNFELDAILAGLSATVGARFNHDERDAYVRNRTAATCRFTVDHDNNTATPEINPGLAGCQLNLEASFEEPTYNLGVQYQATDDLMFYLATRHGYRSGGFGARGGTEATLRDAFEPELVTDYEFGMKSDWDIGGVFVRTNVAIFHAEYTDIQRLLTALTVPPTTVTWNAGRAEIQGIELEFLVRPTDWLEFSGFYAYTDSDFLEFIGPPPGNVDLSGNPFSRAPRNISSASAIVTLPIDPSLGEANVGVSFFHQDRYSGSDSFNPAIHWMEAHDLVDFTAEWNGVFGSSVDLSAWVRNAFDNEYVNPYFQNSVTTVNAVVDAEPRTYGVRLRYNFGGE